MSSETSWTDKAKKLVAYHSEAQDFIRRAGDELPVSPDDALTLGRLWEEADGLDELVCTLLDQLNNDLLKGEAEFDTTRGASVRRSRLDQQETLFYDCTWSLTWGGCSVVVNLSVEGKTSLYEAQVAAGSANEVHPVSHPISESALKAALVSAYVAEATRSPAQ
ncbi:MAG: hypothetical protein IH861_10985 [Chloroflexi bacterium]|nr:hypothetical protein [Chloroflexota bacterium]